MTDTGTTYSYALTYDEITLIRNANAAVLEGTFAKLLQGQDADLPPAIELEDADELMLQMEINSLLCSVTNDKTASSYTVEWGAEQQAYIHEMLDTLLESVAGALESGLNVPRAAFVTMSAAKALNLSLPFSMSVEMGEGVTANYNGSTGRVSFETTDTAATSTYVPEEKSELKSRFSAITGIELA